jgi:hypothetical protein
MPAPATRLAITRVPRTWTAASRRSVAAIVALSCAAVLGVAAWLEPSPAGLGTHLQLGAAPCGWIAIADMPCPTCGMTTAFAHAANGEFLRAVAAQPLGALLAIATAMTLLVCLHIVATGSRLGGVFGRMLRPRAAWTLAAVLVVSWIYKIAAYRGWI